MRGSGVAVASERRLVAILAADVVGSSRLIEADEGYALGGIRIALSDVLVAAAARHGGRLIKTLGDGALLEFASPVAAVICAVEVQRELAARGASEPPERRILLRIGINLGDVVAQPDGDLYGDGVNVAARLEGIADPGGIMVSGSVHDHLAGKFQAVFTSKGEASLKNIVRPVRIFALSGIGADPKATQPRRPALALPDRSSLAVLPFMNMSGDPEQEYFADGIAEDIIMALSRVNSLFVIARNSSFIYKGRVVDIRQVGRELGVRYVLVGSVRKAGDRVRIAGQLIEAENGRHVWADWFDGDLAKVFELQDQVTASVAVAIEAGVSTAEIARSRAKPTESLDAHDSLFKGNRRSKCLHARQYVASLCVAAPLG